MACQTNRRRFHVLQDGKPSDVVAIGTFYFDAGEGSGMERRYGVLALDGDGNRSATVLATPTG
jgi:inorganic pyrophosphatase